MPVTFECAAKSCLWFPPGASLLDVAQQAEISTIAACGGQSICSTCRVEVIEGLDQLTERSDAEKAIALKRQWPSSVRLACAASVVGTGPIRVKRLVTPPDERRQQRRLQKQKGLGQIRKLAVLFADMRNFTAMTEALPAFDVVYILNRFYTTLKEVIVGHHGVINLIVGDEISAVFGLDDDPRVGCRAAVVAALEMLGRIKTLSRVFEREFGVKLEIGIGIHFGAVIVGQMGPVDDLRFGLVGETVIIASRLESYTRVLDVPLLVSASVVEHLQDLEGITIDASQQVSLKGIDHDVVAHSVIGDQGRCPLA